jgi:hypothetical protein
LQLVFFRKWYTVMMPDVLWKSIKAQRTFTQAKMQQP